MFISCDWGTSAFRLRVIESYGPRPNAQAQRPNAGAQQLNIEAQQTDPGPSYPSVIATLATGAGIAATFAGWQASGLAADERVDFYRAVLEGAIGELAGNAQGSRQPATAVSGLDLRGVPVIVSGMASSSIGMLELPYHPLPLDVSGVGLQPATLPPTTASPRTIYLVPGVRSLDDVMRGEETQLIGCSAGGTGERIFVFPGTHSKHIRVRGGRAVDFKTYMTGEVFSLLARQSILAGSVATPDAAVHASAPDAAGPVSGLGRLGLPEAFYAGVEAARSSGLLHNAFLTRTNQLFGKYGKEDNYQFLSGLLIGEELRELAPGDSRETSGFTQPLRPITLVASSPLREAYVAALGRLGVGQPTVIDADQALVAGHCAMIARFGATIAP